MLRGLCRWRLRSPRVRLAGIDLRPQLGIWLGMMDPRIDQYCVQIPVKCRGLRVT
jgi:hypothetical protein